MPLLLLAYLAFLAIALPDGLLGVSWPSMSASVGQPLGALGLILPFAVASTMLSSTSTGALLARIGFGRILAGSIALSAAALLGQSLAPTFWVIVLTAVLLSAGSGAVDTALNAFAARRFDARQISWLHAVYALGAAAGPVLFVLMSRAGISWRGTFASVAGALALLALLFALTVRRWPPPPRPGPQASPAPRTWGRSRFGLPAAGWWGASMFATQAGVESGTALWAYVFLTEARAVPPAAAAATVSAYWLALLVGRVVLGPVANRTGAPRVLVGCLAGMVVSATLLLVPGPVALVGIVGMGLCAAPLFPLLTLTTPDRVGSDFSDRAIGLQGAASAAGAATFPALIGLLIGPVGTGVVAPCLLVLVLGNVGLFAWTTSRSAKRRRSVPAASG
ncbi:MAG: hypothetical protein AVDCRST_MAG61-777 [uncultured Friedmanniella sp.]|uniref:Major facilitator superfamily (MFS) profile domain-containing protein n=1 Tax=uncultured Friedmanniella sp. TaxID=335381 RepID=A0A6J4K670_9ACTN|nr:MFS transporter [uncultured Friedmanniella sp.]CAA9296857.1 MAG: hypothetical protein AVDCRST_MAG61-777 [uncultured Friedmanniella sp.]